MVSDGFFQGYMTQSLANANRDIELCNAKIRELRDLREEDGALIDRQARKLQEKDAEIARLVQATHKWSAAYEKLQAELEEACEESSEATENYISMSDEMSKLMNERSDLEFIVKIYECYMDDIGVNYEAVRKEADELNASYDV